MQKPPVLAVWGNGDPFFRPAGAWAFRKDVPDAEIHLFDTGHFALETDGPAIAALIRDFLARKLVISRQRLLTPLYPRFHSAAGIFSPS